MAKEVTALSSEREAVIRLDAVREESAGSKLKMLMRAIIVGAHNQGHTPQL